MQHSKPAYSKTNTEIGHVPQRTGKISGGRAGGATHQKAGTASGEDCKRMAWGPIKPSPGSRK